MRDIGAWMLAVVFLCRVLLVLRKCSALVCCEEEKAGEGQCWERPSKSVLWQTDWGALQLTWLHPGSAYRVWATGNSNIPGISVAAALRLCISAQITMQRSSKLHTRRNLNLDFHQNSGYFTDYQERKHAFHFQMDLGLFSNTWLIPYELLYLEPN